MKITDLVEILNFQSETREELNETNLNMLYYEYEKMFKDLCGQIPIFKIIDKKGKIYVYGYLEYIPKSR